MRRSRCSRRSTISKKRSRLSRKCGRRVRASSIRCRPCSRSILTWLRSPMSALRRAKHSTPCRALWKRAERSCASPVPRLANAADELLPVRLRRNGRVLGGALSWEDAQGACGVRRRESVFRIAGFERRHDASDRFSPSPIQDLRARPGRGFPTARRSSPRNGAARGSSCCFTSTPTRAGRICRSRASSSTC